MPKKTYLQQVGLPILVVLAFRRFISRGCGSRHGSGEAGAAPSQDFHQCESSHPSMLETGGRGEAKSCPQRVDHSCVMVMHWKENKV